MTMRPTALLALVAALTAGVASGKSPSKKMKPPAKSEPAVQDPADFYSAFEKDTAAAEVQRTSSSSAVAMPKTYSSLPLQLLFEGENDDVEYRMVPARTTGAPVVSRSFRRGACAFEISTGEVAVSSHRRYPDNSFFVVEDSILKGATLRYDMTESAFLSVSTDLKATLTGGNKSACIASLRKGPLFVGNVTLDGTRLVAASADKNYISFSYAAEGKTVPVYLGLGANGVMLRGADGAMVTVESDIFSADTAVAGYYDLDVRPNFTLRGK